MTGEPPALIDTERIPQGLRFILEKATREQPAKRYQTVGALMDAIETYIRAKGPDLSPSPAFEAALEEAKALLQVGRYRNENIETLIVILLRFVGEPVELIKQFDRLPDEILPVMGKSSETFPSMLEAYCVALDDVVGGYNFAYAEIVARKMDSVFKNATGTQVKVLAMRATLIAAVRLNRYAAMDIFDEMLTSITADEEAFAVAEMLKENQTLYGLVAARVPKNKLHTAIREAHDSSATV